MAGSCSANSGARKLLYTYGVPVELMARYRKTAVLKSV
jgi:hypothetical protein